MFAQVYQFYNIIGAPFGDYGTSQNFARFHCIREELRRTIDEPEDVNFSYFYREYYLPLLEYEQHLHDSNNSKWKHTRDLVTAYEKQYRDFCQDDDMALARMGLSIARDDEEYQDKDQSNHADDHTADDDFMPDDDRVEKVDGDEAGIENAQISGSALGSVCLTVNGGNMGAMKGPPVRVRQIKRKRNNTKVLDKQLAASVTEHPGMQEDIDRLAAIEALELLVVDARKTAGKSLAPKPTFKMHLVAVARPFLKLFLSEKERNGRLPGHVRYNEILMAMLYWYYVCIYMYIYEICRYIHICIYTCIYIYI